MAKKNKPFTKQGRNFVFTQFVMDKDVEDVKKFFNKEVHKVQAPTVPAVQVPPVAPEKGKEDCSDEYLEEGHEEVNALADAKEEGGAFG